MRALGLAWVGIFPPRAPARSGSPWPERFDEMVAFLQDVVGLTFGDADDEVTMLHTARRDSVEVFRPHARYDFATTGPIPGFLVEDATAAARELAAAGAELLGEGGEWEGNRWQHFRAPDGFVYEVTSGAYDPNAPGPGLEWAGSRSTRASEMAEFAERVLGMDRVGKDGASIPLRMANGSGFDVFLRDDPDHAFMGSGPVVGFGVADPLGESLGRLNVWGAEVLAVVAGADGSAHGVVFRAPDGCVYELFQRGA